MKYLLLLLLSLQSQADVKFYFHGMSGESDRYYRPLTKKFKVDSNRMVRIKAYPGSGHSARNQLEVSIKCEGDKFIQIYEKNYFCGLTHVSYNNASKQLTLHFTRYNPTVAEGDCSGDAYTEQISLADHCKNSKHKKQNTENAPQEPNFNETPKNDNIQ